MKDAEVFDLEKTRLSAWDAAEPDKGGLLIEASAGTGKTYSIERIVLKVLGDPALQIGPESLLVVTFTRAATSELRNRLRECLRSGLADRRSRKGSAGEDASCAVLQRAYDEFDRASIQTIDGFMAETLQAYALSTGISAAEGGADDALLRSEVLDALIRERLKRLEGESVPQDVKNAFTKRLCNTALLSQRLAQLPASFLTDPPSYEPDALAHLSALDAPQDEARRVSAAEEVADADGELRRAKEREAVNAAIFALLLEAQRRVEKLKTDRGTLTFDDIRRLVAAASRDEAFAGKLRRRFRCVLVDEFQDTDKEQYEIFRNLFLKPIPGETEAERQARIVIFVGDPKQAIYGFRGADITAYLEARKQIAKRCQLPKNWRTAPELVEVFNTLFEPPKDVPKAEVLFEYEAVEPMSAEETTAFPLVVRESGAHSKDPAQCPSLPVFACYMHDPTARSKDDPEDDPSAAEADAVAADAARLTALDIRRLLRCGFKKTKAKRFEPIKPDDIAVLCRDRKQLGTIRSALQRIGLRSTVIRQESIYAQPEAFEIRDVMRAALTPKDFKAFAAAAATELMGLSIGEVLAGSMPDDAPDGCEAAEPNGIATAAALQRQLAAREALVDFRERVEREGFGAALALFMEDCGSRYRALNRPGTAGLDAGRRRLAALSMLSEKLDVAARQLPTLESLLFWLDEKIIAAQVQNGDVPEDEVFGTAYEGVEAGRIRLMTMHGSKGLEFPVVYLPYAMSGRPAPNVGKVTAAEVWEAQKRMPDDKLDPRDRLSAAACFAAEQFEASHPAIQEILREKNRAELEEELRILYVAMTRAKSRLVVVFDKATNPKKRPAPILSLLSGEMTPGEPHEASGEAAEKGVSDSAAGHDKDRKAPEKPEEPAALNGIERLHGLAMPLLHEKVRRLQAKRSCCEFVGMKAWFESLHSEYEAIRAAAESASAAADDAMPSDASALPGLDVPKARTRFRTSFTNITANVSGVRAGDAVDSREQPASLLLKTVDSGDEPTAREADEPFDDEFSDAFDNAQPDAEALEPAERTDDAPLYPTGAKAGDALHRVLECLDFQTGNPFPGKAPPQSAAYPDEDSLKRLIRLTLDTVLGRVNPAEGEDAARVLKAIEAIRARDLAVNWAADTVRKLTAIPFVSPADPSLRFRLSEVGGDARRSEMNFSIGIADGVTAESLNAALAAYDPRYAFMAEGEHFDLTGLLTGSIDLAMSAAGRWWILDWKTNRIETDPACVTRERVAEEVRESRYHLQYLLYLVAFRRWLAARLRAFGAAAAAAHEAMDAAYGGVFYVFLRWLEGRDAAGERPVGFYFDRPAPALLDALDDLLRGKFARMAPDAVRAHFAALRTSASQDTTSLWE